MLKKFFNLTSVLFFFALFPINTEATKLTYDQEISLINQHLQINNLNDQIKQFPEIIQLDLQSHKKCKIYIPRALALDIYINNINSNINNVNIYWDGECEKGIAYGLGRLVFLLPDNHYEIILNLNGDPSDSISPYIIYDFKNLTTSYIIPDKEFPKKIGKTRKIDLFPQTDITTTYYQFDSLNEIIGYGYSLLNDNSFIFSTFYNIKFENIDLSKSAFNIYDEASRLSVYDRYTSEVLMSYGMSKVGFISKNQKNKDGIEIPSMSEELQKLVLNKVDPATNIAHNVIQNIPPLQFIEKKYLYENCQKGKVKYFLASLKNNNICTWGNEYKDSLIMTRLLYLQQISQKLSTIEDKKIKQNLKNRIDFYKSSLQNAQNIRSNMSEILSFLELFNIFL